MIPHCFFAIFSKASKPPGLEVSGLEASSCLGGNREAKSMNFTQGFSFKIYRAVARAAAPTTPNPPHPPGRAQQEPFGKKPPGLPPLMGRWSQSLPYSKPPWSGGFTVGDTSGTLGVIDLVAASFFHKIQKRFSKKADSAVSHSDVDAFMLTLLL